MRLSEQALGALKIRPEEFPKVALMFAYLLLVVTTIIIGRITRDALFVTNFDEDALAYMYVTVAIIVPLFSAFYARIADRFRRDRIIVSTLAIGVMSLLVIQGLVLTKNKWIVAFLYNWIEVIGAFVIIQFWTFAGDIFSSREAKRLFPIVGGGGILASMLCGVAVTAAVKGAGLPTEFLLLPQALALLLCIVLVTKLAARERSRLQEAIVGRHARKQKSKMSGQIREVFQSKHLKLIAGMTVATFITVPLIDYQFKILAKEAFTTAGVTDTDGISSFMGYFYSATGVVAALMQLTLTGRILERFGVVVSLLVLPLSLLSGTLGLALGVAVFSMAVFAKGAENAFRYSIYDATMQVIYTPVPGHLRGRAKTLIDGILKPWAGGLAGLTIALFVDVLELRVTSLSFVALVCSGLWIFLILRIRREYVSQLLSSLKRRRLDFSKSLEITDSETIQILIGRLGSSEASEVRHALELVPRVRGHDLSDDVVRLLQHDVVDIRVRAIKNLGDAGAFTHASSVLDAVHDPAPEVRAAAIHAYCAIVGEPSSREIEPYLKAVEAPVRGAAVAGLIRHGGLDSVASATETLREMRTHQKETVRYAAACVFEEIAVKNFFQPVLSLMNDESLRVQTTAIRAAGQMAATELIPALVYKLGRPETCRSSGMALARYGEIVAETLGKVLSHAPEDVTIRRQVPRILERIGSPRCLELLMACLEVKDPDTRGETAHAAARLRARLKASVDEARVSSILEEELQNHYQLLAALEDLNPPGKASAPSLLSDALRERLQRSFDRIFRFLGILYPLRSIELIHQSLKSANNNAKSNAVEVLDNLLSKDLKKKILPLVDELSLEQRLQRGLAIYDVERRAPEDWLREFVSSDDPWLVVVALHVVSELGTTGVESAAERRAQDRDPLARETSIKALSVLVAPERFVQIVRPLEDDKDRNVRRYAKHMLAQAQSAM